MIIRSSCEEEEMDLPSYSIRLLSNAPSANAGSSRRSEAIFPLQKVPFFYGVVRRALLHLLLLTE